MRLTRRRSPLAEILHLDPEMLVVNKPSGVVLGPGRAGRVGLPDLLAEQAGLPADEPFRIVHRLHENASGVVVYARRRSVQRDLIGQFSEGRAQTIYLALVTGHVDADGEIDTPLYFDKRAGKLQASERRGRPASTRFRVVERVAGNTLLECEPVREQTDQVRAHLAAFGHALAVDPELGGGYAMLLSDYKADYRPNRRRVERPLVNRLTLHAARVTLCHPATRAPLEFTAPLPRDLRATLNQLRRLR